MKEERRNWVWFRVLSLKLVVRGGEGIGNFLCEGGEFKFRSYR